ncbi:tol-pal system protein YbgF [compost metagenome]
MREHPQGNKVPDALLQAGEVLERLGDADEARATYQDIERRFPDTTASAEATRRRARLGGD